MSDDEWVECPICDAEGGWWETADGDKPGTNIRRWVVCHGCNGDRWLKT